MEVKYIVVERAKPFHFKNGRKSDKLFFFVHGFSESPGNIRDAAEKICGSGIDCYGVRLPGHGTHHTELEKYTYKDFVKHSEKELLELSKKYKEIYLVGISLGGTICVDLALKHPEIVRGISLIGSPYSFPAEKFLEIIGPTVLRFKKKMKKDFKTKYLIENMKKNGSYDEYPLESVFELMKYLKTSRKKLKRIKIPVVVVIPKNKSIAGICKSELIYEEIGSKKKDFFEMYDYYFTRSQVAVLNHISNFFGII